MVLDHQLAHNGKLKDGLFELVYAGFGGEQGVEVVGDALPGLGKISLVRCLGQGGEQGLHQDLMGFVAVGLLLLQLVA